MQKFKKLPVQTLIREHYLRIERLQKDYQNLSATPHRHDHYELVWALGDGEHFINFKPYPLQRNRIYFLQLGQVHQFPEFERSGWIFLISEELMQYFFSLHPQEEGKGLFDTFSTQPFVDMDEDTIRFLRHIIQLLLLEQNQKPLGKNMLFHLTASLLLLLNTKHASEKKSVILSNPERKVLLDLRKLIQKHYRDAHGINFYLNMLHVPAKTLNRICRKATGKTVHELFEDKLLTEAKMALLSTSNSVKEIAFDLGFNDPAYFGRFFKRVTGFTPLKYRAIHSA
ncbi:MULTISPECIES: helix-turn-helix domain-containing protein [Olivibacter]|jgi:AraC-like DNA-binding protein|uniref:Transcriptional regulator, AraC family n=3 Tax=Sphingobacteriaceae TaxID=84566 RepID=F4CEV6_SPHS2|nr:helix-turn-helix domain-containing protein [Olivibacter jilunii]MCL4640381.1 helix-turn-helix domain-containing protein [Olivibacter sp. UJ_SKK_5.1]MDX3915749.1 helix-turn-helix domain-containing protein [Pseudosphingobacterium sp.]